MKKKKSACFAFHGFTSDFSGAVVADKISDNMLSLIISGLHSILLFLFRMSQVLCTADLINFFLQKYSWGQGVFIFLLFKVIQNLICLLEGALRNVVAP